MKFTNEQLQKMIDGETIGEYFPYNTNNEKETEKYLINLFHKFKRSNLLYCDAEFNHYGSGYASFVEFFFYKKDGSSVQSTKFIEKDSVTSIDIKGLVLYVSRLAPVAVFGRAEWFKYIQEIESSKEEFFGGRTFLHPESPDFGTLPEDNWQESFYEIKKKLSETGYFFLQKDYLTRPLSFETKIPTILSIPKLGDQYKIFDAIFYWSD